MNNNLQLKRELTLEELAMVETEMLKRRKTKEAVWGLWAGLHFFGAHRFYTENYSYAGIMLTTSVLPIVGIVLLSAFTDIEGFSRFMFWVSIIMLIGSVIWSWIDALFLNRRIEEMNHELELEIIHSIKETVHR